MNNGEPIKIKELFDKYKFEVPIYQRNYAWTSIEIEQLIEDVFDYENERYYVGTIVANIENEKYKVIDGQQRLTTIFLLLNYLELINKNMSNNVLSFDFRENDNYALNEIYKAKNYKEFISNYNTKKNNEEQIDRIYSGYVAIDSYLSSKFLHSDTSRENFIKKLNNVYIFLTSVDGDPNTYFETMNTRGEQLELIDVLKGRLFACLQNDKNDLLTAEIIWDVCSNMKYYVQQIISKDLRIKLFDESWENLANGINEFEDVKKLIIVCQNIDDAKEKDILESNNGVSINNLLKNKNRLYIEKNDKNKVFDNNEKTRFESVISFSNFVLHVKYIYDYLESGGNNIEPFTKILDDKNMLKIFENITKNKKDNNNAAKKYIYLLLLCRILFDRYIIKRDSKVNDDGDWSLKKVKKYGTGTAEHIEFVNTFNKNNENSIENNIEEDVETKRIIILEASLRITYNSPKTMDWISKFLLFLVCDANRKFCDCINYLEKISINKLYDTEKKKLFLEIVNDEILKNSYSNNYGDFERINFTYLDYMIYRDYILTKTKNDEIGINDELVNSNQDWDVIYRTSIEHFYPQNPKDESKIWEHKYLDSFGNLALISISANSTVSNYYPEDKMKYYKEQEKISLKLLIMNSLAQHGGWNAELALKHGNHMIEYIKNEVKRLLT